MHGNGYRMLVNDPTDPTDPTKPAEPATALSTTLLTLIERAPDDIARIQAAAQIDTSGASRRGRCARGAHRYCPHPGVAAVKFVAQKEKIRAARSASLTSAADRAAMAPGEFNASKLGDPRDDGHFAAAAVTAGRGA